MTSLFENYDPGHFFDEISAAFKRRFGVKLNLPPRP